MWDDLATKLFIETKPMWHKLNKTNKTIVVFVSKCFGQSWPCSEEELYILEGKEAIIVLAVFEVQRTSL
jgi:hypothetical protein